VCTSPLSIPDGGGKDSEDVLRPLTERLSASRAAEKVASDALGRAEAELTAAKQAEERAVAVLDDAYREVDPQVVSEAELDVARLCGAIDVLARLGEPEALEDDDAQRVLVAAKKVLKEVADDSTKQLFAELNDEIVGLARELGVVNLDSVRLDLAGKLNARKSGDQKPTAFKTFSPGDRLRLRIAIVTSLIRVGRRHGINSHPGLLLIDSPADVEMVAGDAKTMFTRLLALGRDIAGLQIVLTTSHDSIWDVFPSGQVISGRDGGRLF